MSPKATMTHPPGLRVHSKEWMAYIAKFKKPREKRLWAFRAAIADGDTMGNPKQVIYETSSAATGEYVKATTRYGAASKITKQVLEQIKKDTKVGKLSRTRFRMDFPGRVFILHFWTVGRKQT